MGYTTQFSDLEQSRRLDPEHFYPAFQNLIANLPDHVELTPLGPQLTFCQRGIRKFYVWVASDSFQQEIRRLYDQVAASEQRSKELLEQAKTRVEQLIEEAAE